MTDSTTAPPRSLRVLNEIITACERCPELRSYCADVAARKKRAFAEWQYWGAPVPGFGDHHARIWIVGLAPAAHGANRTGRMFTGDRSGDFLYAALHRIGLANQPTAVGRDDGLELQQVYISAALRCAPPANKPTPRQLAACSGYLAADLALLDPPVILCLGAIAWRAALATLSAAGRSVPRPRPAFGHGTVVSIDDSAVVGCYHVSQQNTFTGRLTEAMIDAVLLRACDIAGIDAARP